MTVWLILMEISYFKRTYRNTGCLLLSYLRLLSLWCKYIFKTNYGSVHLKNYKFLYCKILYDCLKLPYLLAHVTEYVKNNKNLPTTWCFAFIIIAVCFSVQCQPWDRGRFCPPSSPHQIYLIIILRHPSFLQLGNQLVGICRRKVQRYCFSFAVVVSQQSKLIWRWSFCRNWSSALLQWFALLWIRLKRYNYWK